MSIEQVIESIDEQISRLQQAKTLLNGTGAGKATGRGRGPRHMTGGGKSKNRSRATERRDGLK